MTRGTTIVNIDRVDFQAIYNATFQYVYRFFYYKSVNSASIEDLAHDVYLRFYKKYGETSFELVEAKRILFGFCRNVYREWVREQIKEKRSEFLENYDYDVEHEGEISTLSEPDDVFEEFAEEQTDFEKRHESQKELLKEAISRLNPRVKEILECRFFHNMTRKEIAEKLNMNEKDVHTYQKRGIKYLRKMIHEDGGES